MTKSIFAVLLAACNAARVEPLRGGPLACRQSLEAVDICVASRVR